MIRNDLTECRKHSKLESECTLFIRVLNGPLSVNRSVGFGLPARRLPHCPLIQCERCGGTAWEQCARARQREEDKIAVEKAAVRAKSKQKKAKKKSKNSSKKRKQKVLKKINFLNNFKKIRKKR